SRAQVIRSQTARRPTKPVPPNTAMQLIPRSVLRSTFLIDPPSAARPQQPLPVVSLAGVQPWSKPEEGPLGPRKPKLPLPRSAYKRRYRLLLQQSARARAPLAPAISIRSNAGSGYRPVLGRSAPVRR